jgi:8-oxo-dGTP pyrophosphatase MutT (NUDIX family)
VKKFKILSKKLIVDEPYCQIEKQQVLTHNGTKLDWFVQLNYDAVIVVPFFKTGEVLLQKAYKHGAQSFIIEFPAGLTENKKELLKHAAARELREETGIVAKKITKIGSVLANPTGSPMRYHFFIAEGCQSLAEKELDDAEQTETFLIKNFKTAENYLLSTMQPKDLALKGPQVKFQTSTSTIAALPFVRKYLEKNKISRDF